MKTLDEVIKSFEWCCNDDNDDCDGCPYNTGEVTDCHERNVDALHYLKEYQACGDCAYADSYLRCTQDSQNEPLDWETLKQMEGKPVWVEYGIGFNQKRWVVIHSFHNTGSFCYMDVSGNYPNTFWQKDMGEDEFWQAYRKERS